MQLLVRKEETVSGYQVDFRRRGLPSQQFCEQAGGCRFADCDRACNPDHKWCSRGGDAQEVVRAGKHPGGVLAVELNELSQRKVDLFDVLQACRVLKAAQALKSFAVKSFVRGVSQLGPTFPGKDEPGSIRRLSYWYRHVAIRH